ncbi:hypothetical protein M9H77_26829 [Catharanthus roseus]|uniref:Uncharacterized protein n=1 Tax=Catharanthus roseus TaxID=4058 RepID=A0ACC0AEV0_CATRO|nr:hypothetical protein M9H77_26829 [Catharanthus roseus]
MMQLSCDSLKNTKLVVLPFSFLLLTFAIVEGKSTFKGLQKNVSSSSPWLKRIMNPRAIGCWNRPWICNPPGQFPLRRFCCRNRCVDVTSDVNNCGLCGIRCPFTWQCCRGICIDTSINPFHCGTCEHRCPFRSFCFYDVAACIYTSSFTKEEMKFRQPILEYEYIPAKLINLD